MGITEAKQDGIKYYVDEERRARGWRNAIVFLVPCAKCGTEVKAYSYGRKHEYLCPDCRYKRKVKRREVEADLLDTLTTKSDRRLMAAVDKMRKQTRHFEDYSKDVEVAGKAREKFDSIPEAMVAIELLHLGYRIIPQQKVGRYHVDFYLPEEKIVVEVDGSIYHQKQTNRDAIIQLSLGLDVKIVHIPAELIEKNIHKLERCLKLP